MTTRIFWDRVGDVGVLRLDDGKVNAIDLSWLDALNAGLDRADAEGVRALVIEGRSGIFCAGFDLKEMRQGGDVAAHLLTTGMQTFLRIFSTPIPIVAACTGHALAAGALLLLVSDVRVGPTGEYKFGFNETAIGIALPAYFFTLVNYRVPPGRLESVILGETLSSQEAARSGILDQLVDTDRVVEAAHEHATRLAVLDPVVLGKTKNAARGAVRDLALQQMSEAWPAFAPPTAKQAGER